MASKQTVSRAVRAETSGDEEMDLLIFVSRMPETELAVLQETDTSKYIVDFVRRANKAAGAAAARGSGSGGATGAAARLSGSADAAEAADMARASDAAALASRRARVASKYYACCQSRTQPGTFITFTVINDHGLATCRHCEASCWERDQELKVFVNDPENNRQLEVDARVLEQFEHMDIVLLETIQELEAPPLDMGIHAGEPFVLVGGSNTNLPHPFSIGHGSISSTIPDARGFIRSDTESNPGDSGGGCFSIETGKLVAMNMANDRTTRRAVLAPISSICMLWNAACEARKARVAAAQH